MQRFLWLMMDERSMVQDSRPLRFLCISVVISTAVSRHESLRFLLTLIEILLPNNHTMISRSRIVKRRRIGVSWTRLIVIGVDRGIKYFRWSSPRIFQSIYTLC